MKLWDIKSFIMQRETEIGSHSMIVLFIFATVSFRNSIADVLVMS
jgi:hypothetical protein